MNDKSYKNIPKRVLIVKKMDKKQTAVDWLMKSINQELEKWSIGEITGYCYKQKVIELTLQAKQIEKEQILDAYGVVETNDQGDIMNAEQYYNETYNSKQ